jgi:hypothetical protein
LRSVMRGFGRILKETLKGRSRQDRTAHAFPE